MKDNIFSILGVQSKEDSISNAIAFSFNNSLIFRRFFLESLCQKDINKYSKSFAYTRVSLGSSGVPDIVITLESNNECEIVVIENKLKAGEGENQTIRYSSPQAKKEIVSRFFPKHDHPIHFTFIFLTLFPDQKPASSDFQVRLHSLFSEIFTKAKDWENATVKQLIEAWANLTENFYGRGQVSDHDDFCERLKDTDLLDGGYLYFRSAFGKMQLPGDLQIDYFFRSSELGRKYYGVVINKPSWYPKEILKINDGWQMDPNAFHLHFEPQYNLLNENISLFLHYEVNPYETEKWVRKNIRQNEYKQYLEKRSSFIEHMRREALPYWVIGGGSNQVAKAVYDFRGRSFLEVKREIENSLSIATCLLDRILHINI